VRGPAPAAAETRKKVLPQFSAREPSTAEHVFYYGWVGDAQCPLVLKREELAAIITALRAITLYGFADRLAVILRQGGHSPIRPRVDHAQVDDDQAHPAVE